MAKQKLTVKTDVGTFTRSTNRTYAYIVVAKGERAEVLEAGRLEAIKHAKAQAAKYRRVLATGQSDDIRRDHPVSMAFDLKCHAEYLADGSYAKWAEGSEATAAKLEADGPITEDAGDWSCVCWNSRLDLAVKEAAKLERYRHVRIYDVDSDALVRELR
jgi:hypothetical protein